MALEPFTQVNYNAYVHSTEAYGGKPKRYREVQADFHGHVAELLAKCTKQSALDQAVTKEDREMLLVALRNWGALDANYEYVKGLADLQPARLRCGSRRRAEFRAGAVRARSRMSDVAQVAAVGGDRCAAMNYEMQSSIFQPKGGMGMIGKAFGKELGTADPVQLPR